MSSAFRGLGIALSAISAQQRALDVIGHNISNVNTPGYTRQIVNQSSIKPQNGTKFGTGLTAQYGMGVDVQEIKSLRDEFLDKKLNREYRDLGYWNGTVQSVTELENLFNDTSEEGLQTAMDNYWNSWEQLSKPNGGITARALVKENAIAFIDTVKYMDSTLTNFRRNKDTEIKESIGNINGMAKKISELNKEIQKVELYGVVASDIRDQRNLLIKDLSTQANIQVLNTNDNTVNISLDGRMLVEHTRYDEIMAVPDDNNTGYCKLTWKSDNSDANFTGGTIKSTIEARDELVKGFRDKVDELVKAMAAEVNIIHNKGFGVGDSVHRSMFINTSDGSSVGINLGNIGFNPELNDFDNIAAGLNAPPNNNEDNRIALEISTLRQKSVFSDVYEANPANAKFTFDEFYRNIVTDIGMVGADAITTADSQKILIDQLEYKRKSVSSVSLDEELSNLMRYEHSYNAASRMVNVMDEMLDIIISKTGLSGR